MTILNQTILIPMPTTKPAPAKIDISKMSETELRSLQQDDPFMYHSIPSVYRAKLLLKDVYHSQLTSSTSSTSSTSWPSPNNAQETNHIISRKTRLSTECDMHMLLDDLLNM
mmetsp:Transcript_22822/g.37078  ORF Transcript_22822/g.37078 Transcript_22822/m.37078 type:complete len:112 (+) Transcript_22822:60-395(+)|eukprot:CAMPEP_0196136264 /NCGR_PEP_ID=MMETSP0910-20130528/4628_1 /TAXON_ID=49265 /ORGANISM="Thalassiosira rotula, Strain GSO102" /LENGTH=111 /DNA_ID=CAMNT_0041396519 /DNA_START=82 /DNA_END=417 /DNA_ORIENTATION=-